MKGAALTALLSRDRAIVLAALVAAVILAWTYLLLGAGIEMEMMDMGGGAMMAMPPLWTPGYAAVVFAMWAVMMVAMMLPSAAPVVLLSAALDRQRNAHARGEARAARAGQIEPRPSAGRLTPAATPATGPD